MATVGRKNLKEQAKEPVPAEEKDKNETTEVEEDDIVEEPETVEKKDVEPVEVEKKKKALKAITHILYNGRMYGPQEELPVDNAEMVEAWIAAETAIWD